MKVHCGSCRTEFDVPGAGRFQCPNCGTANAVGGGVPPPPVPPPVGGPAPPPFEAPPPIDVTRLECPECSFSFIVGEVDSAPRPNCNAQVDVGSGS